MDEDKKKKITTIVIIAVCLVLAIAITLGTREGGGGVRKGKMWVKCANPDCEAEYQMTNKEYAEELSNVDIDPMMMMSTTPALVCQECQEESIFTGIKCSNEECGAVFFRNTDERDYPDRCSECGVSETEESRNKREEE